MKTSLRFAAHVVKRRLGCDVLLTYGLVFTYICAGTRYYYLRLEAPRPSQVLPNQPTLPHPLFLSKSPLPLAR
jgi:hypothetical protein